MTDAQKLQAILDFAKRNYEATTMTYHIACRHYYNDNDGTYTYDTVDEAFHNKLQSEQFFNKVKQIIERPDEYLAEEAWLDGCIKQIYATRNKRKKED